MNVFKFVVIIVIIIIIITIFSVACHVLSSNEKTRYANISMDIKNITIRCLEDEYSYVKRDEQTQQGLEGEQGYLKPLQRSDISENVNKSNYSKINYDKISLNSKFLTWYSKPIHGINIVLFLLCNSVLVGKGQSN